VQDPLANATKYNLCFFDRAMIASHRWETHSWFKSQLQHIATAAVNKSSYDSSQVTIHLLADPGKSGRRERGETKAFLYRNIRTFAVCSTTLKDCKASHIHAPSFMDMC
jgi:hypothetical protein